MAWGQRSRSGLLKISTVRVGGAQSRRRMKLAEFFFAGVISSFITLWSWIGWESVFWVCGWLFHLNWISPAKLRFLALFVLRLNGLGTELWLYSVALTGSYGCRQMSLKDYHVPVFEDTMMFWNFSSWLPFLSSLIFFCGRYARDPQHP